MACAMAAWAGTAGTTDPEQSAAKLLLPRFERFGIVSLDQLARSLRASWPETPGSEPELSRPHAWMLSAAQDDPGQLRVWTAMAWKDPDDLEATYEAVRAAHSLHDFGAAEALLAHAQDRALVLRDDRGGPWTVADLEYLRCLVYRDHRSAKEALPFCLRAATGTSAAGPLLAMGRVQLLLNDAPGAVPFLDRALNQLDSPAGDRAAAHFLRGVALRAQGMEADAQAAWNQALAEEPGFFPADRAVRGVDATSEKMLASDAAYRSRRDVLRLVGCGHLYLDLGLPQGAERCFAAAQALWPGGGWSEAERLAHHAEGDLQGALNQGQAVLAKSRTAPVLDAVGWILHRQGKDAEARPYFDEVLRNDPRDLDALRGWTEVCRAAAAPECGEAPIVEQGIPSRKTVDRTVLQLALSLVPLGVLYVLLRRRLR